MEICISLEGNMNFRRGYIYIYIYINTHARTHAHTHTHARRWADKFCFHCNIFIYIRHIWIKPVLCSRMVSPFHHNSPLTHAYVPYTVHIEKEAFSYVRFKQRAFIEFLTAGKVRPIEIHTRMQAVYGDQCFDASTVRRWVRRLKR